ncbi:GNAT family N-acetyltransferase [Halobacteriaceae archaeon GCM10025711]
MPGAVFLQGDDVALRTIEEEDLEFLRDTINDPRVRRFLSMRDPVNLHQEREFFEEVVASENGVNLLVTVDGEAAGTVGLHPEGGPNVTAEIGLFLAEAYWGNGYGTEASELLTDYAFDARRFHRVTARVYEPNVASARIWEKLGFRHEATFREADFNDGEYVDVRLYAVLEDEWRD